MTYLDDIVDDITTKLRTGEVDVFHVTIAPIYRHTWVKPRPHAYERVPAYAGLDLDPKSPELAVAIATLLQHDYNPEVVDGIVRIRWSTVLVVI